MKNPSNKITLKHYLACTFGFIMSNFAIMGYDHYSLYFMTDVAAVDASIAGTVLMVTSAIAAFADPIIANYVDQTNSRWGKYRPYLMFAPIIVALATILRFASPNLGNTGAAAFYGISSIIFIISLSFASVPTVTLTTALSDDYNVRNQLLSVRSIASTIVQAVLGMITLGAVAMMGGGQKGWLGFGIMCAVIIVVSSNICQFGIRDVDTPGKFSTPPKRPLFKALLSMLKNKPIMYLTAAMFLVTLVTQMGNSVAIHYYEHVLNDTSVLAKTSGFAMPITLAVPFLMPLLLRKISKRALAFGGFILTVLMPFCIMVFGAKLTVNTVIILILINRAGRTLLTPCISSLVPECVDFVNWKEGAASVALITATVAFGQKMARSAASGAVGGLLSLAGYNAANAGSAESIHAILNINGIYQVAALCLAMIPIIFFPINKKKGDELRAAIAERDAAKNAN